MDIYERIFEHTPDAILVIDLEGRIRCANVQTSRLFGYDADELVGLPVETLIPERLHHRHVAHRDGYAKPGHRSPSDPAYGAPCLTH